MRGIQEARAAERLDRLSQSPFRNDNFSKFRFHATRACGPTIGQVEAAHLSVRRGRFYIYMVCIFHIRDTTLHALS